MNLSVDTKKDFTTANKLYKCFAMIKNFLVLNF